MCISVGGGGEDPLFLCMGGPQGVYESVWGVCVGTRRRFSVEMWGSLCGCGSLYGKGLGRGVLKGSAVCGGSVCVYWCHW